jgi:hypothetical protein
VLISTTIGGGGRRLAAGNQRISLTVSTIIATFSFRDRQKEVIRNFQIEVLNELIPSVRGEIRDT